MDNGPEFTASVVREWLKQQAVKTLFIEPGSPWENGSPGERRLAVQEVILSYVRAETVGRAAHRMAEFVRRLEAGEAELPHRRRIP